MGYTGTHDDLRLWWVHEGVVEGVHAPVEVNWVETILVAATTEEAARDIASEYDAGLLAADNLTWDGATIACAYSRDEDGFYA